MKRKIVGILIIGLFIGASFIPVIRGDINDNEKENNKDILNVVTSSTLDQLDQQQTAYSGGSYPGGTGELIAQSFTTSLNTLTKVELYMHTADRLDSGNIIVSIRDSLNGADLTSKSISLDMIGIDFDGWVEFDFNDIAVIPDEKYYIVLEEPLGEDKIGIFWMSQFYFRPIDFYPRGNSSDYLPGWGWYYNDDYEGQGDYCFKTYGYGSYENHYPDKPEKPEGENIIEIGRNYTYSTICSDQDNDKIMFCFDWGDSPERWRYFSFTEFFNSNVKCFLNHSWENIGNYSIRVRSIDECGFVSDWSDPLNIMVGVPILIVDSIKGGFGIRAEIKNNGGVPAYNVSWSIDVNADIGLILSGSHADGLIDELEAGDSQTIQFNSLRGIGLITITVQVGDADKEATAFLLGPLVLRVIEK